MFGFIELSIWRNDILLLTVKKKENEIDDFILNFLTSFNDDATYEIVGIDNAGYCIIDLYGNISRIQECLNNDKPFNI